MGSDTPLGHFWALLPPAEESQRLAPGKGVCMEWGLQEQLGPFHWKARVAFQDTQRKGGSCLRKQQALSGRHKRAPPLTE